MAELGPVGRLSEMDIDSNRHESELAMNVG